MERQPKTERRPKTERKAKVQEEDAGPNQEKPELLEKVRTEERQEPELQKDNKRSGEEPTTLTPRHIPGGMWLHKVRAYLSS
ncbi:hypothetical protein NDU88_002344 [Pleurodeles waltl]|uniref:Uncharacterized protein n=1 Tax=Pleurodeles waltl TaxID=8319 RepID=A0AAV7T1T0_PLEWA|nr:hypothetical protein NDU88_002344 [Pleurodeles waltl]